MNESCHMGALQVILMMQHGALRLRTCTFGEWRARCTSKQFSRAVVSRIEVCLRLYLSPPPPILSPLPSHPHPPPLSSRVPSLLSLSFPSVSLSCSSLSCSPLRLQFPLHHYIPLSFYRSYVCLPYGVATVSRLLKIIRLFCRIEPLL